MPRMKRYDWAPDHAMRNSHDSSSEPSCSFKPQEAKGVEQGNTEKIMDIDIIQKAKSEIKSV
jgi:hypothetical protein